MVDGTWENNTSPVEEKLHATMLFPQPQETTVLDYKKLHVIDRPAEGPSELYIRLWVSVPDSIYYKNRRGSEERPLFGAIRGIARQDRQETDRRDVSGRRCQAAPRDPAFTYTSTPLTHL